MRAEIVAWALGLVIIGVLGGTFLALGGPPAELVLLIGIAVLLGVAAHLGIGLTQRPILALPLPLSSGWWAATAFEAAPVLALALAAGVGAAVGALVGYVARGSAARVVATTLLLALLAEGVTLGFAANRLGGPLGAAPSPALVAGLAVLALGLGWWLQGSLLAALLDRAAALDGGETAGLDGPVLQALATGLAGAVAGLAGALIGQTGGAPPGLQLGFLLVIAAFAGGRGLLAGTLALTAAFWLLPEVLARASAVTIDVDVLALALAGLALLVALWTRGLDRRVSDG
ncbi:MAG: hypothetical protein ACOCYE_09530 [Pseudomonadota bacterium]